MEAQSGSHKHIEAAAYPHVQRYIKRLRKTPDADFRYLAIYERGSVTGRSHYHMFIHETGKAPITKSTIDTQWRSFVGARLLDGDEAGRDASYLTKYATKHFDIRPRASVKYGKLTVLPNSTEFGSAKDQLDPQNCTHRRRPTPPKLDIRLEVGILLRQLEECTR